MSIPLDFYDDPDNAPQPPDRVRITELRADPLPDGRRVVITVRLTPFLQKPSFDVTLFRDGVEQRSTSVVGVVQPEAQFTMHLSSNPAGTYVVRVDLLRESGVQQVEEVAFEVH